MKQRLNESVICSVQFSSVTHLCLTLCDPMNHSTPGLPVHHQLPEFTQTHVHRVSDAIQPSHPLSSPSPPAPNLCSVMSKSFATPWIVAHQAPLSMGFSRKKILEWLAIPFTRGLPDPGIEPESPALQANSSLFEPNREFKGFPCGSVGKESACNAVDPGSILG